MKEIFVLLILIILPSSVLAQMFSVGGEAGPAQTASSNYLRAGYVPLEFYFSGNESAVPQQNRLDFESSGFMIALETRGLNASVSFINRLTGSDDERYLNLSLEYINRFAFINTQRFNLGTPVGIRTNLVSIENEQEGDEFNQTVLALAVGGFAALRVSEKISIYAEGIPSYGFSTTQGGFFGGTNKSIVAKARVNLLNILPGRSISFGYDYNLSSYDLDNDDFDYDLAYHAITLGVSL